VIFYIIFSFVGSVIFLFKIFEPVKMGILSLNCWVFFRVCLYETWLGPGYFWL